jgi:hypothetical protein
MKRITTTFLLLFTLLLSTQAQDLLGKKWYQFTIGGNKGYFVKTTEFSKTTMTENQFGSGSTFDNSPVEIKIAEIYTSGNEVRVITEYGDSSFYVLVFRNFTDYKVQSCMNTDEYKNIADAKTFVPKEEQFSDWFTEKGYKAEDKKPVMPPMTRNDAVAFTKYFVNAFKDIQAKADAKAKNGTDEGLSNFAMVMVLATVPNQYAAMKGFNQYKSAAVIEKGLAKYKNDAEIKKILSAAGLDKLKK